MRTRMRYQEKLELLKAMSLLNQMPERSLKALAEFLKPRELPDGTLVFEEGARGMSVYFVAKGRVRIAKQTSFGSAKELAVVQPGEFFGEMALIEEIPRSASATAIGPTIVFELFRDDLSRWVKTSPQQAVQFFAELSQVQSRRLRKTSRELTLHFDIEDLLADEQHSAPEFLNGVLERVVRHLGGSWSAAAYLKREGTALERVSSHGERPFDDCDAGIGVGPEGGTYWVDEETFQAGLTRKGKTLGRLVFRAPSRVAANERDDLARTLSAVCPPITAGLEIIGAC